MITPLLKTMNIALKNASNNLTRDFGEIEYFITQSRNNKESVKKFVASSNQYLIENIYKDIKKIKPTYGYKFNTLPTIKNQDESNYFIIHDILGLENFSKNIPYFAICISLERNNKIYATSIYNPITLEMFSAELGNGSFYNQRSLRNKNIEDDREYNVIALDSKSCLSEHNRYKNIHISNCKELDICYVASKKLDSLVYGNTYDFNLLEAPLLVATESGLNVTVKQEGTKITSLQI